jgi:hypothetical protein
MVNVFISMIIIIIPHHFVYVTAVGMAMAIGLNVMMIVILIH